jgi:hypothetical protein
MQAKRIIFLIKTVIFDHGKHSHHEFAPYGVYYRHFVFTFSHFSEITVVQFTFRPCGNTHGSHMQKRFITFVRPAGNFGPGAHG